MASHTLAPKGSSAYEKGVREGRAMTVKSRTPEPEEAEEEQEGEEEELDMAMNSRKRSSKGAKNTKPAKDGYGMKKPMDAEGCSGGPSCMSKGPKGKCDGSCGKAMKDGMCGAAKKMDSLTPQEYLAACDLGIQNRSRPYIRARLDAAAERLDLKCGKGSISKGEKCSKGAATAVSPQVTKGLERGTTEQLVNHRNTITNELVKRYSKPIQNQKQYNEYAKWEAKQPEQAEVNAVNSILKKRIKRDSPYAAGFSFDTAALAI